MRTYAFGYRGERLTIDQLERRSTWSRLHPEVRRRLRAMFDHAQNEGRDVGIGGGWRSSATQEATFRSRYDVVLSSPWNVRWDGLLWRKKPNVAPAAPPGRSYHEETTSDGFALAADLIGDLDWVADHAAEFGLRTFRHVNAEPWHVQPIELPTSRSKYQGQPLEVWRDDEEPTMVQIDYQPGTPRWVACIWTGTQLGWLVNGHVAAVATKAGVQRVEVSRDQFLGLIQSAQTTTNAPPMEPDLVKAWDRQRAS